MTLLPGHGPGPNTTAWTREAHQRLMYEQREDHLRPLTVEILRDLARNPGAPHEWRRAAVEMLIEKHAPYVNHPDLADLLREIQTAEEKAKESARSEVESIVESQTEELNTPAAPVPELAATVMTLEAFAASIPPPLPAPASAPSASITTASLTQDDVIDNR